MTKDYSYYKAINWNEVEDELDNAMWERATSLFWLDTRLPLENDKDNWDQLSTLEKARLERVLAILAKLATYQAIEGGEIIRNSEHSQPEVAFINNLQFTEMVNTKAYNRILQVFNGESEKLNALFDWVDEEKVTNGLLEFVDDIYAGSNTLKKHFMAIYVEGAFNFTLLAYLLQLWTEKDFTSLGRVLRMIIQNESLHCLYLTHKLNLLLARLNQDENVKFELWVMKTVEKLRANVEVLINNLYGLSDSRELAKELYQQELKHILDRLGIVTMQDQPDNDKLQNIDHVLKPLQHHHLRQDNFKTVKQTEDLMTDDDYSF